MGGLTRLLALLNVGPGTHAICLKRFLALLVILAHGCLRINAKASFLNKTYIYVAEQVKLDLELTFIQVKIIGW
jgi:hypothetical protein